MSPNDIVVLFNSVSISLELQRLRQDNCVVSRQTITLLIVQIRVTSESMRGASLTMGFMSLEASTLPCTIALSMKSDMR